MTYTNGLKFVPPWRPAHEKEEAGLKRRLTFEVTAMHPLWGVDVEVIGRSEANDDIVIMTEDGRYGIVHLVWGASPGDAAWPVTYLFAAADELSSAMREWSKEAGFPDQ